MNMWKTVSFLIFCNVVETVLSEEGIKWCTVSSSEQKKCSDFSRAVNRTGTFKVALSCQQAADKIGAWIN
ncbi:hypothetical protein JTE90_029192 [Oedothorax gibbosus]|uniref:Transferrin-like domain-containing protein n=1 Tax=Oedothorax gibbosus TaxID=931172 RepID=A0AAV6VFS5_9ARAC|nr:hypothetical protein JTE90_029192 [Oedothorax gibbosus]